MAPSIVAEDRELDEQRTSGRGLVLGGMLVGASLMLGVLGLYVFKRTREADEVMRESSGQRGRRSRGRE